MIGDEMQDKLLTALRDRYPKGLTGTEQRDLFNREKSDEDLTIARASLERKSLIRTEKDNTTGGRARMVSYALAGDQRDIRRRKSADDLFGRLSSLLSRAHNGTKGRVEI